MADVAKVLRAIVERALTEVAAEKGVSPGEDYVPSL